MTTNYFIYFDGIVFSLQHGGGISVYYNELLMRMRRDSVKHKIGLLPGANFHFLDSSVDFLRRRPFERYLDDCSFDNSSVFHSTYYRLPKNRSVPVVTTVHDFTYEKYVSGPRRWIHSLQKTRAISNSNAVICISESTKRDLLEYFPQFSADKVHVIHNAASDSFFPLPSVEKKNDVLFVGARRGYKNFNNAVLALAKFPDLRFVIVGGGPIDGKERYLLDFFLPNRWQSLGFVTDSELNQLYNSSYFLLYPSIYEGFGIPVIEAMQAGCAVIAVGLSSIPEVCGAAGILSKSGGTKDICVAIHSLLKETSYSQSISDGFANARRFSWENCYNKTLSVYASV